MIKLVNKFIICFTVFFGLMFESNSQDSIFWNSKNFLRWVDFKGKIDKSKEYAALASTGISLSLIINDSLCVLRVKAFFVKKKSWVRTRSTTALKHEQGHFDIAEIFARKIRNWFIETEWNAKTFRSDLILYFNKIKRERDEMHDLYDYETSFSTNMERQKCWNEYITSQLNALKHYSNIELSKKIAK